MISHDVHLKQFGRVVLLAQPADCLTDDGLLVVGGDGDDEAVASPRGKQSPGRANCRQRQRVQVDQRYPNPNEKDQQYRRYNAQVLGILFIVSNTTISVLG